MFLMKRRCDKLTICLQMRQIIKILPKDERQTMLFSATQTTKVEDLARISLRPGPLYINVENTKEHSTVEGLEQGYVVCDSDKRFLLLFSFLKRQKVCHHGFWRLVHSCTDRSDQEQKVHSFFLEL